MMATSSALKVLASASIRLLRQPRHLKARRPSTAKDRP
jgi:hypothetical protein